MFNKHETFNTLTKPTQLRPKWLVLQQSVHSPQLSFSLGLLAHQIQHTAILPAQLAVDVWQNRRGPLASNILEKMMGQSVNLQPDGRETHPIVICFVSRTFHPAAYTCEYRGVSTVLMYINLLRTGGELSYTCEHHCDVWQWNIWTTQGLIVHNFHMALRFNRIRPNFTCQQTLHCHI